MAPSSSTRASGGAGTRKILEKLQKSVESGNFYEAQQMYKTIYARYMASKKYEDAMDLLQSGACVQLQYQQLTCGIELGILLIEVFVLTESSVTESSLGRIRAIYEKFPHSLNDETNPEDKLVVKSRIENVSTFLKTAIKWSVEYGGKKRGAPELHDMLADYIWTESSDLARASQHYVRGKRPDAFASAIVESMKTQSDSSQCDLILARYVLLYLSLGNLRDANKLLAAVKATQSEVLTTPLSHFVKFILLTLERDALPLFRMLRENYKLTLERDSSLDDLLDEVGERFYSVPRKNGLQNIFGDFMKMFIDGGTN